MNNDNNNNNDKDSEQSSMTKTEEDVCVYNRAYCFTKLVINEVCSSYRSLKNSLDNNTDEKNVILKNVVVPSVAFAEQSCKWTGGLVQKSATSTYDFVRSEQGRQLAERSLVLIRSTPVVGDSLGFVVVNSAEGLIGLWDGLIHMIHHKNDNNNNVEELKKSAGQCFHKVSREVFLYFKMLDQTLTRVLMKTQWKVLGTGPYVELDQENRDHVLDHICERYFSISDDDNSYNTGNHSSSLISRYEMTAHIRIQNRCLYHDLVESGLLFSRANETMKNSDVWLHLKPPYRQLGGEVLNCITGAGNIKPLWFYLPKRMGKEVSADTPWVQFSSVDSEQIEAGFKRYRKEVHKSELSTNPDDNGVNGANNGLNKSKTLSKWHDPDKTDVLVQQNRYAVSFHEDIKSKNSTFDYYQQAASGNSKKSYNDNNNISTGINEKGGCSTRVSLQFKLRPILWRFIGDGEDVRRSLWTVESGKNGLQPFDNQSSAILEDAFLFLYWKLNRPFTKANKRSDITSFSFYSDCIQNEEDINLNHSHHSDSVTSLNNIDDNPSSPVLLTIQVTGPSGEELLVQFRSLSKITAISKTLGGGLSIFKKRVYRGGLEENSNSLCSPFHCTEKEPPLGAVDNTAISLAAPSPVVEINREFMGFEQDCEHLVLVVHGVGEMLQGTDLFGLALPQLVSIVDCCTMMRQNHKDVVDHASEVNTGLGLSFPTGQVGRVEYIPVEWHEKFNLLTRNGGDKKQPSLSYISLNTIPGIRHLANDTLLDILYFMSPYHDLLLSIVTEELNLVVNRFKKYLGKSFTGKVSIFGHSLGSIISWDILSSPTPQLDFTVSNMFSVGSPIGVFLMIRNQHKPMSTSYFLPSCKRIYNIFHPYDPVAYRIEPLLHPKNAAVEPELIPHWRGGFRVHYQTKMLLKELVQKTYRQQQLIIDAVENGLKHLLLVEGQDHEDDDGEMSVTSITSYQSNSNILLELGQLNGGRRIDYALQETEVEVTNEYVFALGAHSCYFATKDLSMFMAREIAIEGVIDGELFVPR